jgi:hypothetical protein
VGSIAADFDVKRAAPSTLHHQSGKCEMPRSSSVARQPQMADRPPSRGGAVDGRSPTAKRRKDMIADLVAALGGHERVTAVQMNAVVRAAELAVLASATRARALSGDATVDMEALVRLEGASARAIKALNLPAQGGRPKPPSLAEHLAQRAARAAGAFSGEAT